jgi:hypothetical protein
MLSVESPRTPGRSGRALELCVVTIAPGGDRPASYAWDRACHGTIVRVVNRFGRNAEAR